MFIAFGRPHIDFTNQYVLFNVRKKIPIRRVFLTIYHIGLINVEAPGITQKEPELEHPDEYVEVPRNFILIKEITNDLDFTTKALAKLLKKQNETN